jgi:hypothetical protein
MKKLTNTQSNNRLRPNMAPNYNQTRNAHRLSRGAERFIGGVLIASAVATGYFLPHGSNHKVEAAKARPVPAATASRTPGHEAQASKSIAPRVTHTKSPAIVHKETHVPSPTSTQPTVQTKAEMQAPLSPRGGEWNTAEAAVWDAGVYGNGNFTKDDSIVNGLSDPKLRVLAQQALQTTEADALVLSVLDGPSGGPVPTLSEITIPRIRTETVTALNEANADAAALDATNDDFNDAHALISQISNPKIASQVTLTIRQQQAGNIDAATSTWSSIDNAANSDWSKIDDAATGEWNGLYLHTDQYWDQYQAAPDK